jgi:hypothetical protein
MAAPEETWSRRHYRLGFVATATLVLAIIVTLPFSLASIVDDVLGPASGKVIPLLRVPPESTAPVHSRLHLAVTRIDELQLLATLRVSGHRTCDGSCPWKERLLLVSVGASRDGDAEGVPPSATIVLPDADEAVSETIQLPVSGAPIRYPFDRYDLVLGVALRRIYPDGRAETLTPEATARHLRLTIQEMLPRKRMSVPIRVDPGTLPRTSPAAYAAVYEFTFEHPRYIRVLAVLLVLLMTAAAAYSVFLRPVEDLLINAGALVLSVWGVRAILTPGNLFYLTAIDVSLSMVILFLLSGLAVKVLILAHDRGGLRMLRRRR